MSKKPETVFRELRGPALRKLPNTFFESIQQVSIHGSPDWMGGVCGHFTCIEWKASEDAPSTPLQIYKAKLITDIGGVYLKVHPGNFDEIYAEVSKMSQRSRYFS